MAALAVSPFARSQFGQGWFSEPGLAWLPSPSRRAVSVFRRHSSSHTHSSCTLWETLGCWSQKNQAIPSSISQGTGIVWPLHQPALDRKESGARAAGRSRLGLSAASLSCVMEQQPGRSLSAVPSNSHHQGHPARPLGCPQEAPGPWLSPVSSPLQFQGSPSTGHGTSRLRYPAR